MPIKNRIYGQETRDRETEWETDARSKPSSRWSLRIVGALLLLAIIGIAVVVFLRENEEPKEEEEPASLAHARQVAEAFLAEADPDKRLQWVRNAAGVRYRFASYPEEARSGRGRIQEVLGHNVADGRSMTGFLVTLDSGNKRLLELTGPPEAPRVDWDAYACHSTAS